MGNYFGNSNRAVLLGACIGVWVLCATGVVMWWKRRPRDGHLSAPPPATPREARAVFIATLALSLLFPLTALSLVVIAVLDRFAKVRRGRARVPDA